MTRETRLNLLGLEVPERHSMCKLTVTATPDHSDVSTCDTFEELSKAIDAAMAFARYEVGPAGDR